METCIRCGKQAECIDTDHGPLCLDHMLKYEGDLITQLAKLWFPKELEESNA